MGGARKHSCVDRRTWCSQRRGQPRRTGARDLDAGGRRPLRAPEDGVAGEVGRAGAVCEGRRHLRRDVAAHRSDDGPDRIGRGADRGRRGRRRRAATHRGLPDGAARARTRAGTAAHQRVRRHHVQLQAAGRWRTVFRRLSAAAARKRRHRHGAGDGTLTGGYRRARSAL